MEKYKINDYIKTKWNGTQKELADAITEQRGDNSDNRVSVNKWFKNVQEPGKEFLIPLSNILNVPIEALLLGRDIVSNDYIRPTAYVAALSGDEQIIKRLFQNKEADIYLDDKDEYGKSFIDYVIEFNNYKAFKTAVELGYGYPQKNGETYFNLFDEREFVLLEMIIKNDDEEMFLRVFPRGRCSIVADSPYSYRFFYHYKDLSGNIPQKMCDYILQSEKIKKIFLDVSPLCEKHFFLHGIIRQSEWELLNDRIELKNSEDEQLVRKLPSLSPSFNCLLMVAIENKKNEIAKEMLEVAERQVDEVRRIIGDRWKEFAVENNVDGALGFADSRYGIYAFMPNIYPEVMERIEDDEIRQKAESINSKVEDIRKRR